MVSTPKSDISVVPYIYCQNINNRKPPPLESLPVWDWSRALDAEEEGWDSTQKVGHGVWTQTEAEESGRRSAVMGI